MTVQSEWTEIGHRVREARLAVRLSQDQLGRRVGLERTMIAKIEAGGRRVDAVELVRLAEALDVPLGQLVHEQPPVLSRRTPLFEEEVTEAGRESLRLEFALTRWLDDLRQLRGIGLLPVTPILARDGGAATDEAAREAARWTRERLDLGNGPIESLMAACERAGLLVAVVDLPGEGASVVDGDLAAAVVSRLGPPGRRRATAAHELGHVVLGDEYSSDLGVHASRPQREAIIDGYAAELLLPADVIRAEGRDLTRTALVRLAGSYRVSWTLAVRQAVRAGTLAQADAARWQPQTPTRAELLDATGWAPQPDLEWLRVPPGVAHAALQARAQSLITTDRALELLRGQLERDDLPPLDDEDEAP
ncbi:transcriptional regulator with XRE-family HTH domain [Catenuloplanes nepalensis]|uniref:Transcriptional regulator with XRE-family HTH domain n=1 Tax=Catenuloplanes nepalensis TaxID=587533 RepID=A0ABT9MXA1_9ACTN|nr:XRE family transcriptional regulator [Catenuloplanes nepalensis]MDP9796005.1 transcriptional regulator with XRE-family HTH domain [Catenuloplanes nepalensis]